MKETFIIFFAALLFAGNAQAQDADRLALHMGCASAALALASYMGALSAVQDVEESQRESVRSAALAQYQKALRAGVAAGFELEFISSRINAAQEKSLAEMHQRQNETAKRTSLEAAIIITYNATLSVVVDCLKRANAN